MALPFGTLLAFFFSFIAGRCDAARQATRPLVFFPGSGIAGRGRQIVRRISESGRGHKANARGMVCSVQGVNIVNIAIVTPNARYLRSSRLAHCICEGLGRLLLCPLPPSERRDDAARPERPDR